MSKADKLARKKEQWAALAEAARVEVLSKRPQMNAFEGQRQKHIAATEAYELGMVSRPDERIMRGMPGQMTRKVHQYCGGACGTNNPHRCGGRYWANRYPLSSVVKNDATLRIAAGAKTRAYLKQKMGV